VPSQDNNYRYPEDLLVDRQATQLPLALRARLEDAIGDQRSRPLSPEVRGRLESSLAPSGHVENGPQLRQAWRRPQPSSSWLRSSCPGWSTSPGEHLRQPRGPPGAARVARTRSAGRRPTPQADAAANNMPVATDSALKAVRGAGAPNVPGLFCRRAARCCRREPRSGPPLATWVVSPVPVSEGHGGAFRQRRCGAGRRSVLWRGQGAFACSRTRDRRCRRERPDQKEPRLAATIHLRPLATRTVATAGPAYARY